MFEQFQFSDGEVEVLAEMLDLVWEDAAARSGAGWCGQLRHGSSENWTRILIIYICIYIDSIDLKINRLIGLYLSLVVCQ